MDFRSFEQFVEIETKARQEADSKVIPEQAELKVGDFFVRCPYDNLKIYSEILDPSASILDGCQLEELDEEELEEYEDACNVYKQDFMKNYRFTRSYSYICPRGELGDVHISSAIKISKEEFYKAMKRGWL